MLRMQRSRVMCSPRLVGQSEEVPEVLEEDEFEGEIELNDLVYAYLDKISACKSGLECSKVALLENVVTLDLRGVPMYDSDCAPSLALAVRRCKTLKTLLLVNCMLEPEDLKVSSDQLDCP